MTLSTSERPTAAGDQSAPATVRDATFAVMRRLGLTTIFGNPGSTEVSFLVDLPDDIRFVLGLHEGSVVGMASGYAIGRGAPAFVNLHTAPGLGNAVNAIANARDCRAPLVVVVGQQDRRQLALSPFLTGRALERMAGEYPVWTCLPPRAQDVPGAIARAYHEAMGAAGPALVVVPMGDWSEPADEHAALAPERVGRPGAADPEQLHDLAELLDGAQSPALVVGAGTDSAAGWEGAVALAERLRCPVWHEPFSGRIGFPSEHPLFAGHLHWQRRWLRETLAPHDVVLVLGTNAFRLYLLDETEPPVREGTRVAVITADPEEAYRSQCELALVAPVAAACRELAGLVRQRAGELPAARPRPAPPSPPAAGEPLSAAHVLAALAERLAPDVVVVEESPSSRPDLLERIPARAPLALVSPANGALGFGLPGAIGLRMALPGRGVVAVLGDGSATYVIQGVWSAARYGVGVVWIVMRNGGYEAMDFQARERGSRAPWPSFGELDLVAVARGFGCPAIRVSSHDELVVTLDDALADLAERSAPLLIEVEVGI